MDGRRQGSHRQSAGHGRRRALFEPTPRGTRESRSGRASRLQYPPTQALKQATQTIPIVFAGVSDPIATASCQLVEARRQHHRFQQLRLRYGRQMAANSERDLPGIGRVTVMFNPGHRSTFVFWPH